MTVTIIRAIPRFSNYFQGEQYYNIGELTWQQQSDFRAELENLQSQSWYCRRCGAVEDGRDVFSLLCPVGQ